MPNSGNFASGSAHELIYCAESTFGVTPSTPDMKRFRHTGTTLALTRESLQSKELRHDAQISDFRLGADSVSGEVQFELSYGSFDDFLAAAIRGAWVEDKLKAGVLAPSFTFQRIFSDIAQNETFTGCKVGGMKLSLTPNAMVTGSFSVVGKQASFGTAALSASPTTPSTAAPLDCFSGSIQEGGAAISVITGIELSIENSLSAKYVLGDRAAAGIVPGRINCTGTVSAFFSDMVMMNKFLNETESSLTVVLGDGVTKSYRITLPRIKYSGGNNPVSDEGPIQLDMPFQALLDNTAQTNIIIDRIPGA